jgi:Synergist-CTERM protein sorting domain-containing protein
VSWSSSNSSVATVSNNGLVNAVSHGIATITVTTYDGNYSATCALVVEKARITIKPDYFTSTYEASDMTGIANNDLEVIRNMVYLKKEAAMRIAASVLGVKVPDTTSLPLLSANINPSGQVAEIIFKMTGRELLALYPEQIEVIGFTSDGTWKTLQYIGSETIYADGRFTLMQEGKQYKREIMLNDTYELVVYVEDGALFDLDGWINGSVTVAVFLTTETARKGDSGGGGCNAYGYIAFALLAVPFVLRRR